ncbi:MAG: 5'-nucleotidase C-terminal domain-containing protein [Flavihumibacter sp.]
MPYDRPTIHFRLYFLVALLAVSPGCKTHYRASSLQYEQLRIQREAPSSAAVAALVQPYADSVKKVMEKVIAVAATNLEKKMPEGPLGNLMADASYFEAERIFGKKIDAAFVNYGGIRLSQVPAGPVTLNTVFELMPFDNLLVLQSVSGAVLQRFLDNIAARGGWPVKGLTFVIQNNKATRVMVNGAPLDPQRTYTIANSDYVANGGDDSFMLQSIPQENKGYLVRDALIHYFSMLNEKGEKLNATIENRVRYAQ